MRKNFLFAAIVFLISSGSISAQTAGDARVQTVLNFEGFIIEPDAQFINETEFVNKKKAVLLLIRESSRRIHNDAVLHQYDSRHANERRKLQRRNNDD